MRPVTRTVPKELLPIGTRPMLQWCLTEALEGGFDEIAVITSRDKPMLESYVDEGRWRDGLLPGLAERADAAEVFTIRQERPAGVVDAILSADAWVESGGPFAVLLPDNVRIEGSPPITVEHLERAGEGSMAIGACHRVGPETRHYFGNVGRIELDDLTPAGALPRVTALQERGAGTFRAAPEGAWRLAPRYVVSTVWLDAARAALAEASVEGREADDVTAHRSTIEAGGLRAVRWEGTLVDAGNPHGYLYAQHLLHEAAARDREDERKGAG